MVDINAKIKLKYVGEVKDFDKMKGTGQDIYVS
jgi:hypothetical protein